MEALIPEIDVLIASSLWLWEREVYPLQFSVASGQGIDAEADRKKLEADLKAAGAPDQIREYANEGPDVIGISRSSLLHVLTGETPNGTVVGEYWKIECKGRGKGKSNTLSNKFYIGLAKAVSYYEDSPADDFPEARQYLGLALPEISVYMRDLRRLVRKQLRQRLNLWILLYNNEDSSIRPVSPDDEY